MPAPPDLEAYFQRIGYRASRAPTLATLAGIQLQHAQSIPFENLDPLLRRPVRLDLPALEQKLLGEARGGYCFEHNRLLSAVLQALGFDVTDLAARVAWNVPPGVILSRSHMLLQVRVAGESFLVDVGFGGQTPTGPLHMAPDVEQATPHEPFRLLTEGAGFLLQTRVGTEWKAVYRFDLQRQLPIDYQESSWYLCNFPQSFFRDNLVAARPVPGGRYGLFNNQLSIHRLNESSQTRTLGTGGELRSVLTEEFGVRLPEDPALDATLGRIAAGSGATSA